MKVGVTIVVVFSAVLTESLQKRYPLEGLANGLPRVKRETVGALHILTNHAQPIHADVKQDNNIDSNDKVTAPSDAVYEAKSLRKSLPLLQTPSTLDLVRSVNRLITLTVLIISGVFEFYPILQRLVEVIQMFLT